MTILHVVSPHDKKAPKTDPHLGWDHSVQSLYILPISAWAPFGRSVLLLQSKDMPVGLNGDSKVNIVSVCMGLFVFICQLATLGQGVTPPPVSKLQVVPTCI